MEAAVFLENLILDETSLHYKQLLGSAHMNTKTSVSCKAILEAAHHCRRPSYSGGNLSFPRTLPSPCIDSFNNYLLNTCSGLSVRNVTNYTD